MVAGKEATPGDAASTERLMKGLKGRVQPGSAGVRLATTTSVWSSSASTSAPVSSTDCAPTSTSAPLVRDQAMPQAKAARLRVCSEPGCPALTRSPRCKVHTRSRQQRGYGPAHDQLRAHYQRRMDAGEVFYCWRGGEKIDPSHWHLGHDDLDRSVYRGPECVPCNTATAPRVSHL